MAYRKTIVVLGATGHFGARIVRRLLREPGANLVIASRSASDAAALAESLARPSAASVTSCALDARDPRLAQQLADLRAGFVLHCAGPYQGQDYSVAKACIQAGCHYADLADGRDFVAGFETMATAADSAGVLLVTGASTLPGLSSAVVADMLPRFSRLTAIATCIAPAHRTPRGPGTIAAVLSYCGAPFKVLENGMWVDRYGWQDLRRQSLPGLGKRFSAACDVPDLELFPRWQPTLRSATFHAALEAPWEHFALWFMAALRRAGLIRNMRSWVPRAARIGRGLERFGSDAGGMTMTLIGDDASGTPLTCTWVAKACRNHGPEIPCSPALVLARRFLRDNLPGTGARPCLGLVTLAELEQELSGFDIRFDRFEGAPS